MGAGLPVASQVRVASPPTNTVVSAGCTTNDSSKKTQTFFSKLKLCIALYDRFLYLSQGKRVIWDPNLNSS